jgi:hypothetical protein
MNPQPGKRKLQFPSFDDVPTEHGLGVACSSTALPPTSNPLDPVDTVTITGRAFDTTVPLLFSRWLVHRQRQGPLSSCFQLNKA